MQLIHEHTARTHRLSPLIRGEGWAGYGIYWAIIELLASQPNQCTEYQPQRIAHLLGCTPEQIERITKGYNLFRIEERAGRLLLSPIAPIIAQQGRRERDGYEKYPIPTEGGRTLPIPEPQPEDSPTEWMRYHAYRWIELYSEILVEGNPERPPAPILTHEIVRQVGRLMKLLPEGLSDFARALRMVRDSHYLSQASDTIGFVWFLKENNIRGVLDGVYTDYKKTRPKEADNRPNLHPGKKWEEIDLPQWEPDDEALQALQMAKQ